MASAQREAEVALRGGDGVIGDLTITDGHLASSPAPNGRTTFYLIDGNGRPIAKAGSVTLTVTAADHEPVAA